MIRWDQKIIIAAKRDPIPYSSKFFIVKKFCNFHNCIIMKIIFMKILIVGTIKVCHQKKFAILVSLLKYFESSSLLCNNCHSPYFCSITVTVAVVNKDNGS